jgi:NAD(P)-dependent dehydrogenase (short-subunit alcohol dehydrogenase family)
MDSFANRVVLITGAAQGIGRQLALQLAAEGAAIAAVDLQDKPLEMLASELAGKSLAWAVADVTDRAGLRAGVAELEKKLGPIDVLIANAGIGRENSALAFKSEDFEAQVRVNLIGVANSVEAVLPGMLQRQSGHLVVMSSMASTRGFPRMAGYCAAKAGVNSLFDTLRVELKPKGIAVTTICPAWIRTNMTAKMADRLPDLLEVEDATQRIISAIRERRPYYAFPASAVRRCRLLRWLPLKVADWLVDRQFRRMIAKQVEPSTSS